MKVKENKALGVNIDDITTTFERKECHIAGCYRIVHLKGLCKYHADMAWYRKQSPGKYQVPST